MGEQQGEVRVGDPVAPSAPEREASASDATSEPGEDAGERGERSQVRAGTLRPWTSETAREAAFRSAAARRAKREAAERAAELDKLTVRSRTAVVVAGELTADELRHVIRAQIARAKDGHKDASAELRQWLRLATDLEGDDADEPVADDLASMTPAQRAALRAQIIRQAQQAAEDAEAAAAEHEA